MMHLNWPCLHLTQCEWCHPSCIMIQHASFIVIECNLGWLLGQSGQLQVIDKQLLKLLLLSLVLRICRCCRPC